MKSVDDWLETIGLSEYAGLFARNKVDVEVLIELTDADLREIGIPLGPRKKMLREIGDLVARPANIALQPAASPQGTSRRSPSRRYLTVVFVDLVNYTGMTAQLDPEDVAGIVGTFQNSVRKSVAFFGGYVARTMGDGIMIYFGWPVAHERDPERAVRTAFDVIESVKSIPVETSGWLNVHIGIATGDVVVGDQPGVQGGTAHDVFGSAPNLAARLQALAAPGEVLICPRTQSLVQRQIEALPLGQQSLKGFDEPLTVWRAVKALPATSKFDERRAAGLAPFVNRSQQFSQLRDIADRAGTGHGQFALLVGEAGIGKSRLVSELVSSMSEGYVHQVLQCSQLHADRPFHSVVSWLETEISSAAGDDNDRRIEHLARMFSGTENANEEAISIASMLLSSDSSSPHAPYSVSHDAFRARILNVLNRFVFRLAEQAPLLLVIEDLHWCDPSTLAWINQLVECSAGAPIMVLATMRSDTETVMPLKSEATVIHVGRLEKGECSTIARAVDEGQQISANGISQIVRRSDGNPLFVEELTRAYADSSSALKAPSGPDLQLDHAGPEVPPVLRAPLMSRVDRQPPACRELAAVCSVIGTSFSLALVSAVVGENATDLEGTLDLLVRDAFLEIERDYPHRVYRFRHALIHDTIYGSILVKERRRIHGDIARVLELDFPALCRTEPELLAYHCEQAGNPQAAIAYYIKAAHRAIDRSAMEEARAYLKHVEELLPLLRSSRRRDELELELRSVQASSFMFSLGWATPEVKVSCERALELGRALGKRRSLIPIQWGLATHNLLVGDISAARAAGQNVLSVAEDLNDIELTAVAHSALAIYCMYEGAFEASVAHWRETRKRSTGLRDERLRYQFGTDRYLQALRGACLSEVCLGNHRLALEMEEEQRVAADARGFAFERAYAQGISCIFHGLRRDGPAIRQHAAAGIEIAKAAGFNFMRVSMEKYLRLGEAQSKPTAAALRACEDALTAYLATGSKMGQSAYLASLAELYLLVGDIESGLGAVTRGLDYVAESGERFAESYLVRTKADLLAATGREDEALQLLSRAIDIARGQNARTWELEATVSLATLRLEHSAAGDALTLLAPVCGRFEEAVSFPMLDRARELLHATSKS